MRHRRLGRESTRASRGGEEARGKLLCDDPGDLRHFGRRGLADVQRPSGPEQKDHTAEIVVTDGEKIGSVSKSLKRKG